MLGEIRNQPKMLLGEGAFGQVFKGILRGPNGQVIPVAVKQLKANAIDEEREEFVREIQMMQTVGNYILVYQLNILIGWST